MIAKALQLATEYNSDNNAVNSDSFTENDATGMLLKDDSFVPIAPDQIFGHNARYSHSRTHNTTSNHENAPILVVE
jgi:hypothetical protein